MTAERFWKAVGGRKALNGYLAYLTLTVMAFPLGATFPQYAGAMLLALGITAGLVAFEDRGKREEP